MSDYLTSQELADLIGCEPNRRAVMKTWLTKNAWPFVVDRNGLPKVARSYRDDRLRIPHRHPEWTCGDSTQLDCFSRQPIAQDSAGMGVKRLYKRVGVRKVSYIYKHTDGRTETLVTARIGDSAAIVRAEGHAKRKALAIQGGVPSVDSVCSLIERFRVDIDPTHFLDHSKEGDAVRNGAYARLEKFFGPLNPTELRMLHGYRFLDARAKAGAPVGANRDMALMSTICNYAVRWGCMERNPFTGLMQNKADLHVRVVERSQIVSFYKWSLRQCQAHRTMGIAAMFCYLTGFRSAEVRPLKTESFGDQGIRVLSAKRKRGQGEIVKLRHWSKRLRVVVERAELNRSAGSLFVFPNRVGKTYTKGGWAATWQDAMYAWIGEHDPVIANECEQKKAREASRRRGHAHVEKLRLALVEHPEYFSMLDIRPAAITTKLRKRDVDAYDFAAHANQSTTHKHYDRRRVREASPAE